VPKPSSSVRPLDLVLRCYLRRVRGSEKRWVAHCIDLDLWATGDSPEAARRGMDDAVVGYVETVLDTQDRESIPQLLRRRAPLHYVLFWHLVRVARWIRRDGGPPLDSQPFEEHLPFRLAVA
jgi:predicted RNase H-like HicB family nuclease